MAERIEDMTFGELMRQQRERTAAATESLKGLQRLQGVVESPTTNQRFEDMFPDPKKTLAKDREKFGALGPILGVPNILDAAEAFQIEQRKAFPGPSADFPNLSAIPEQLLRTPRSLRNALFAFTALGDMHSGSGRPQAEELFGLLNFGQQGGSGIQQGPLEAPQEGLLDALRSRFSGKFVPPELSELEKVRAPDLSKIIADMQGQAPQEPDKVGFGEAITRVLGGGAAGALRGLRTGRGRGASTGQVLAGAGAGASSALAGLRGEERGAHERFLAAQRDHNRDVNETRVQAENQAAAADNQNAQAINMQRAILDQALMQHSLAQATPKMIPLPGGGVFMSGTDENGEWGWEFNPIGMTDRLMQNLLRAQAAGVDDITLNTSGVESIKHGIRGEAWKYVKAASGMMQVLGEVHPFSQQIIENLIEFDPTNEARLRPEFDQLGLDELTQLNKNDMMWGEGVRILGLAEQAARAGVFSVVDPLTGNNIPAAFWQEAQPFMEVHPLLKAGMMPQAQSSFGPQAVPQAAPQQQQQLPPALPPGGMAPQAPQLGAPQPLAPQDPQIQRLQNIVSPVGGQVIPGGQ